MDELRTARLTLRRPTPADIDAIFRITSDPRACAHNPSDLLHTRADAAALYHRWDEHWRHHGFGYWAVRQHGETEPIGFCGIKRMRLHDAPILNLFYRLDPAAWGHGFATEAATTVVAWAAKQVPQLPLVARVRPGNGASLRVAARAGLRRAEALDTPGEDGPDLIFTTPTPAPCTDQERRACP